MKTQFFSLVAAATLASAPFCEAIQLQNPELALAVRVTEAARAREFYVESLGMTDKGEAPNPPPGLRMYLYGSGQATLKVRDSETDPPGRDPALLAENGLRFISIPVADFGGALTRLAARGFAAPVVRTEGGVRTGMATDGDGNVVEMIDSATAATRKLEIGIIIPDDTVAAAQSFYTNLLGFAAAAAVPGPSPVPGTTEYRYSGNNTALRIFAPPGTRAVPHDEVSAVLGYRYITFTVARDLDVLYNQVVAAGVEIVTPLSPYGTTAMLFVARGPGGAIHEFVGPPHSEHTAFTDMVIKMDYYAPGQATNSPMSETLEALSLEPHRGRLFCSTSYIGPAGIPAAANPKVLVKDTAASPWRVDFQAGDVDARIACLRSVNFTTDGAGNVLTNAQGQPEPVPVLVAGTGQWRSWYDENDPNRYGVYVLTRNDDNNTWVRHKLYDTPWNPQQLNHTQEVRVIFDHVDQVTGVHYVFASSRNGRIFRGCYDANVPGKVAWAPQPELGGLHAQGLCAAEANGVQYLGIAFGSNGDNPPVLPRPTLNHGLWRRIDGVRDPVDVMQPLPANPQWEWINVAEWESPSVPGTHVFTGQLRGLTAIADPNGGTHEVLAMHWDSPDAKIHIVDPMDNHKATEELDTRAFFRSAWGNTAGVVTVGYNDWLPATHPDTGEKVHLIGAWANYPGGELGSAEGKSSWALVRYADAAYSIVRIWDPANALGGAEYGLRGCRSIRPSPFPNEAGRVWYFCGFDGTSTTGAEISGSRGWIYKGTIGTVEPPLTVATSIDAFANIQAGAALSQTLTATGGASPYTWSLVVGALPPGVSLSSGGLLSGMPVASGSYGFTVQVTDGNGWTATQTFTMIVRSFLVDDVRLGSTSIAYTDPEILSSANRMVFQADSNGVPQIWISELNPANGLLASADGRDLLVDSNVATYGNTNQTANGPEWGVSSNSVSVFYSKMGSNGFVQVWRASNLSNGVVTAVQLTSNIGSNSINAVARNDASRPTTQFAYRFATSPQATAGPTRWADETAPTNVYNITSFNTAGAGPSWIEGTADFAYAAFTSATNSEITRYFTATRTTAVLTSDPGPKRSVLAFRAPELGDELLYACVLNETNLAVFRSNGTHYVRWANLTAPDPVRNVIYTPEPFQVAGKTYFAVQMKETNSPPALRDSSIWVLGLGTNDTSRFARRVDEGEVNGGTANRFDPEPYVSANEVFIYYSRTATNTSQQLRRAATGIYTQPLAVPDIPGINLPVSIGHSYSLQLTANGGVSPYSWELVSGSLPNGLTLSASGLISGTPTANGTFNFTVKATDITGATVTKSLTITVAAPFTPDARFTGQIDGTYGDPEFSETASKVVFQDSANSVWVGDLDPETALFKTATGRDYLMDTNISQIMNDGIHKFSSNGPEWSRDAVGHFVVYTKTNQAGIQQQWMARLSNGVPVATQLTADAQDCYGNMPSRFDDGLPPRLSFNYKWPITIAELGWIFMDNPTNVHVVSGFDPNQMSVWSSVSSEFLYIDRPAGAAIGQVGLLNPDTGAVAILTNDGGDKNDPGFFRAPEYGGEICLVARVDNQALAIYRNLGAPDGFWTRVATLTLPAGTLHKYIFSAEIIAPTTGVGGMSYFAFNASATNDWGGTSERSIWVLGLGTDPNNRFVRRIDDGAATGASAVRMEPEPFVATREVFVFYNFYDPATGTHGLRRARTGIHKDAVSIPDVPASSLAGALGVGYARQLSAAGGVSPYSWAIESGSLPPGLALDPDGSIAGIPTAGGTYAFTLRVTDSLGATATRTLTITVGSFATDDIQVGSSGVEYSDPEFHSGTRRMVFQSSSNGIPNIWIGEVDPGDATLVSPTGLDLMVDTNAATLGPDKQTNNGPEWGEDGGGEAVFYSKMGGNGFVQVWRASGLSNGFVTVAQLTGVTGSNAVNACFRQDASRATTQFFYKFALGPEYGGPARWADETRAWETNNIMAFNSGGFAPSWIPGTEDFAYVAYTGTSTVEIARYNTATRTAAAITSEPAASKRNVIAFKAPEFNNELCYACVADGTGLAVYRNLGAGFTRVATLAPSDPAHPYMYSPEIFQLNGVTYFAVVMQDHEDYHLATDGAIYVLGLGADLGRRVVRRVDDGAAADRFEPEVFIGTDEAFVFFNVGGTLRRARTGIFKQALGIPEVPPSALAGTAGAAYSVQLVASGGAVPHFWFLDAGTLPPGLTLNSNGMIAGTPTTAGTFHFTVGAADALGGSATRAITITIRTPFDAWCEAHFTAGELLDPEVSGPSANPERDAFPNLLEYAFGLEPKMPDAAGGPTAHREDGYLCLTYRENKAAADAVYLVEAGSTLAGGEWSGDGLVELSCVDKGDHWEVTVRDAVPISSAPRRFMRVRVAVP